MPSPHEYHCLWETSLYGSFFLPHRFSPALLCVPQPHTHVYHLTPLILCQNYFLCLCFSHWNTEFSTERKGSYLPEDFRGLTIHTHTHTCTCMCLRPALPPLFPFSVSDTPTLLVVQARNLGIILNESLSLTSHIQPRFIMFTYLLTYPHSG